MLGSTGHLHLCFPRTSFGEIISSTRELSQAPGARLCRVFFYPMWHPGKKIRADGSDHARIDVTVHNGEARQTKALLIYLASLPSIVNPLVWSLKLA
jgi:hypothetical protein